jgi:putative holliday junction resolvase
MPDSRSGNWLGIDYGERLIGIAVAHPLTGSPRPIEPIRNTSPVALEQALGRLLKDWRPVRIVVGLPLNAAGEDTPMSRKIRKFADWLATQAPDAQVLLHDERMSSEAAAREFAHRREQGRARRRDAARLDSMAAALILESWMTEHGIV